jgi:membrane-anchored protein YejM (alkaline phosphatase superfamily)
MLTEKASYGFSTLFSKNEFISAFKVIPLYQPLTFRRIAAQYFKFDAKEQAKYSIKKKADLNYPIEPLQIDKNTDKFNIFIIASDSVKYSILNEDVTPNIMAFSKDALVFNHHYSGGNSTRFGIFSLIYGINATYWFSFLNENQRPVIFDVLQKLNYDISIISSTNTNWPEFRKTCYVNVQENIEDEFKGSPWKKDEQSTACFLSHVDSYTKKNSHFNFIFLDAPHGYSYPETSNKYRAAKGEINYLSISKESAELKTTVKRYKNAVHYNDKLFGKILSKLKEKDMYDNALIIYTSDHGQEFFEQGNFGHNTSFSKGQIHIPLMIKLPKSLKNSNLGEHINDSLTSHQDIVPSILTLLGVKNNVSKYSNGKNFFSQTFQRDYIFSANWNNNAIVSKETTAIFSNLPNKMFNNEVRDSQTYKILTNKTINSKFILDTMNENKKFLK